MGILAQLRQLWKKPSAESRLSARERIIAWRREPTILRIEHPTRLDRARTLGYRAKPGMFVVRVRVLRGGHTRPRRTKGRRSKTQTRRLILRKNYQLIAEERVSKAYKNCEVLNSYPVAKDGKHAWYEVILVDRSHPAVRADKRVQWISTQRGRAHRGLTSAGRKTRGLRSKGKGVEKARPSRRSHNRKQ